MSNRSARSESIIATLVVATAMTQVLAFTETIWSIIAGWLFRLMCGVAIRPWTVRRVPRVAPQSPSPPAPQATWQSRICILFSFFGHYDETQVLSKP